MKFVTKLIMIISIYGTIPETSQNILSQQLIHRRKPLTAKVGIYGVGHHTYWEQFPGLLEDLNIKLMVFDEKVKSNSVEVFNFGIGDKADDAYRVLEEMKKVNIDLLFIDMLTYATSSTIAVIFKELNVPMVMVGLQPDAALPYDKATTYMQLYNDDICAMPEFANVAVRMGRKVPPVIIGTLNNDLEADAEIAKFCQIAKVLHDLKRAKLGAMGHVLENMYDMQYDPTMITSAFSCHVKMIEPDQIYEYYKKVSDEEIEKYKTRILNFFDTPEPKSDPLTKKLTDKDLIQSAKAGVALEKFVKDEKLDGLAYYYEAGEGTEMRDMISSFIVGNSLLTAAGFPMCGEFDMKTCIAMLIMDRLEIGGSFTEFHPIDFKKNFIIVGHDGPHHINIAEGKPIIRSLEKYHGKPGSGASVEFKIKEGPITILSIAQSYDGKFKFIIAEGESVKGSVTPIGNTNTRGVFQPDSKTFLKKWLAEGPQHHFALGIGHYAETIMQIAEFLDIEAVIVK